MSFPKMAARVIIGIFYVLSTCFDIYTLFRTSFTEPGIIPRKKASDLEKQRIINEMKTKELCKR